MGVGASGCGNPANSLARMASARSAALNAKPPRYVLFPADGRLADICPELMVIVLQYLPSAEAHGAAALPLCRTHAQQITANRALWVALCSGRPLRAPAQLMCECPTARAAQSLHRRMVVAVQSLETARSVDALLGAMAPFPRVVGVQLRCLRALVPLLESPENRKAAQDSCITGIVVNAMRAFGRDVELQLAALHSLVLLARPIGGSEGMVFSRGMARPTGLDALLGERGGIVSVLETMARHEANADVQAMACWALVNVMLIPQQKALVVARGGVQAVLRSMQAHPRHFEVQYRALFALINLLVPDGSPPRLAYEELVPFVLAAMETFAAHEALVNRGCLVLHNLALSEPNHALLARAGVPRLLARMLALHPKEPVVQESATGIIRRLAHVTEALQRGGGGAAVGVGGGSA